MSSNSDSNASDSKYNQRNKQITKHSKYLMKDVKPTDYLSVVGASVSAAYKINEGRDAYNEGNNVQAAEAYMDAITESAGSVSVFGKMAEKAAEAGKKGMKIFQEYHKSINDIFDNMENESETNNNSKPKNADSANENTLPNNQSNSSSFDEEFHNKVKERNEVNKKNSSGNYQVVDPLALDLDGNGIQTTAIAGFSGSLFDHNNDGIRTATGWVAGGDGLLVRDLNGNGVIDNGGELFGDNTRLQDGTLAQHGYAALAELDSNADGSVDDKDTAFSSLRIWQDKNQDGISQSDELRTLADLGIAALNVVNLC